MAKWFISRDEAIATVSDDGFLHAVAEGQTSIKVYDKNGKFRGDVPVTVYAAASSVDGTKIMLDKVSATLVNNGVGSSGVQLNATITPDNATNNVIKWTSSNINVATVSNSGHVKAVKNSVGGTATIKAALSTDESIYDTCIITVKAQGTVLTAMTPRTSGTIGTSPQEDVITISNPDLVPAAGGWIIVDFPNPEYVGGYSSGITTTGNTNYYYIKYPGEKFTSSSKSPYVPGGKGTDGHTMDVKNCSIRAIYVKPNYGNKRTFTIDFTGTGTGSAKFTLNVSQQAFNNIQGFTNGGNTVVSDDDAKAYCYSNGKFYRTQDSLTVQGMLYYSCAFGNGKNILDRVTSDSSSWLGIDKTKFGAIGDSKYSSAQMTAFENGTASNPGFNGKSVVCWTNISVTANETETVRSGKLTFPGGHKFEVIQAATTPAEYLD